LLIVILPYNYYKYFIFNKINLLIYFSDYKQSAHSGT
jgi:hypothetical protein